MGIRILIGMLVVCSGMFSPSLAAEETGQGNVGVTAKLKLIESEEGVDTVLLRPTMMSVFGKPFFMGIGGFHWEGTFHPPRNGKVGVELKFVVRSSSIGKEDDQEWHQITTQVDSRFSAKSGETKRIQLNATQRLEITLEVMQADDVQAEDRPVADPSIHSKAVPSAQLSTAAAKQIAASFLLFELAADGKKRLLADPTMTTFVGRPGTFLSGGELIVEGAEADPWEFGSRIDLHVFNLASGKVEVEFRFSSSTHWSPKQGWLNHWFEEKESEHHIIGDYVRSRFKVKLGETKVIRATDGRWLEVKFEEVAP